MFITGNNEHSIEQKHQLVVERKTADMAGLDGTVSFTGLRCCLYCMFILSTLRVTKF